MPMPSNPFFRTFKIGENGDMIITEVLRIAASHEINSYRVEAIVFTKEQYKLFMDKLSISRFANLFCDYNKGHHWPEVAEWQVRFDSEATHNKVLLQRLNWRDTFQVTRNVPRLVIEESKQLKFDMRTPSQILKERGEE